MFNKKAKPRLHLDKPASQIYSYVHEIEGWFVGDAKLKRLIFQGNPIEHFETFKRHDVTEAHPKHLFTTGFRFSVNSQSLFCKETLEISAEDENGSETSTTKELTRNPLCQAKTEKLLNMPEILDLTLSHKRLPSRYDFMLDSYIEEAGIIESQATSSHSYTDEMLELMDMVSDDGWILDCGAGYRETVRKNLVLFEIEPYVTTDVRGIGEQLPFKDNCFDLIFSLVVLEHVKDPHRVVRELERVLKPGGKLWVDAAFMQPFHGYPNHFFNMTKQGLRSLFSKQTRIVNESVPRYGTPIWSLTWFLQRYAQGLPAEARDEFLNLTISDLLASPDSLLNRPWVKELDATSIEHLAATNTLILEKIG